MSNYTLTYRKDKSQEIYIEGKEEKNGIVSYNLHSNSLYFNREYNEALTLINSIIELQKMYKSDNNVKKVVYPSINNRVLFMGQRGCGKTSVILSLANYLENDTAKYSSKDEEGRNVLHDIQCKFRCLPIVDPSHFDNNNNILLTVITSMFSEAKRKMNEAGDKGDTANREELLKQFEKVFKSLDAIKSEVSSYTLESLNRKSDAEDLREKMNDLVAKYLKYLSAGEDSRLVLLIDDIDMSVSHAPEMLEQLRKYLELDNLIILMSANLGQLTNEMREKYSSAFQYTLKDSNQALSIDVEDLATKYLLKLFPTSRRINVERRVSQLLETDLEGVMKVDPTDKTKPLGNFQKVILSLIWSKTRLLFIPKDPENTLHPIIPTNLRDLAQFLDMLTGLKDVGYKKDGLFKDEPSYNNCNDNLQVFKGYIMNTWIPNHLSVDEELVFRNIPTDITEINKHLINSINVIGTTHKDYLMSREVSLDMIEKNAENINIDRDIYTMVSPNDPKFVKANKISDIFNQPSNYSYGDLLLMIDKYETYFESEEHRKFTDAIKIYYSVLLFETMFFKSQNVKYDYKEDGKEYSLIPIQRLIGGNVYYPNYFEIITDKNFNQKGPSFDAKRAFYHKVKVDEKNKVGEKYPLFAVLYYGDIRPDRYEKDHIYDTKFNTNAEIDGVNYVTFDILSVLNNMLNPCHTLSRLDDKNYKPIEDWDTIVRNIEAWGTFTEIESKFVPNAILPFYAVDVMLAYLRHDYSTDVLFKKASIQIPNIADAKKIANYIDEFFDDSSNRIIELEQSVDVIVLYKDFFEGLNFVINIARKTEKLSCEERNRLIHFSSKIITEENKQTLLSIAENKNGIELTEEEKNSVREIASKVWLSKEDKQILELIADKTKKISEQEKDYLKEIASKVWLSNEDKQKIDRIANNTDVLSEEEKSGLLEIVSKVWLTKGDKQTLDSICNKRGKLSNQEKELLEKVASKGWLSKKDRQTLKSFSNKEGGLSDKDKKSINSIVSEMSLLETCSLMSEVDDYSLRLLKKNLTIINLAYGCYCQISLKCDCSNTTTERLSLIELYKNHVIALIYGKSIMVKKEKEVLIKELHKYHTVSEIYKHLVEVLWKNAITEICIHGKIQENVRSFEVVRTYYSELWDETQKMFNMIDSIIIDGNNATLEPSFIYKGLFDEAEKLFLYK